MKRGVRDDPVTAATEHHRPTQRHVDARRPVVVREHGDRDYVSLSPRVHGWLLTVA